MTIKDQIAAIADTSARIDALLAGSSMWYTTPVERLGIPAIKVADGPNGARGGSFAGGDVMSACLLEVGG